MDTLLRSETTVAVIMGASNWVLAGLPATPSFRRSAKAVQRQFLKEQRSGGLGLDPEHVLDFFDDTLPAGDQLSRLRDDLDDLLRSKERSGQGIKDLIFYYIGHGVTDAQSNLGLLVKSSRKGLENETSIRAPDLARVLRISAPKQRRFVILDCCFSESAARSFVGMSGGLASAVAAGTARDLNRELPRRGGLLLCAAPVGEPAIGAPDAEATLFTGSFLEVLKHGVKGREDFLSFADMNEAVYDKMVESFGRDAPRPALNAVNQSDGDLSRLPAFRNQAVDDTTFRRALANAAEMTGNCDALNNVLREAVTLNESWAKTRYGDLYRNGHCGFKQDYSEAARWYRAAADQGEPRGQAFYGMFLAEGVGGIEQDEAEALRFIRKSADQGDEEGMFLLSQFYLNQRGGLSFSAEEGLRWLKASAEGESPVGMAVYAGLLAIGTEGVERDRPKAEAMLRRSLAKGFKGAQRILDAMTDDKA